VTRLNTVIKERDVAILDETRALQREIDERTIRLNDLVKEIEAIQSNSEYIKEKLVQEAEEDITKTRMQKQRELDEIRKERKQYEEELEAIQEFEMNQHERESELVRLTHENDKKDKEKRTLEIDEQNEIRRQQEKLTEEYSLKQEADKVNAKQDAEKNISEIEKNIQDQNILLDKDVRLQNDVITYLEKTKQDLEDENRGYERDLEQNVQTVQEYARKQFEQNKKIKMLKSKIEMLEKSLSKIVEDFEKEKELLKFQSEQVVREQDDDIINSKEQIKIKERELKNLRALCQMILDQRSDVEQFFLESLEQVKHEAKTKKVANPSMSLPDMEASEQSVLNTTNRGGEPKIKLKDLDWEDRERILRLLFSKMNSGQTATNWRSPHEHPSRVVEEELIDPDLNDAQYKPWSASQNRDG
jgi:hypothetical protein